MSSPYDPMVSAEQAPVGRYPQATQTTTQPDFDRSYATTGTR